MAEALSTRDKEKLKEKLALLQREYRKTFSRLQRAERAEKVKSYVKKTVAEQNNLLLQAAAEAAEEGPADSTGQTAPESLPAGSCSETKAAVKTPSVSFSLQPEVFGQDGPLPENSGSDCTEGEHERILGCSTQTVPGKNLSRLSRSRRKERLSVASEERGDAARHGDRPGHEGAGQEGPQSPVFTRRGSHCELDHSTPRTHAPSPAKQSSSPVAPVTPQPEGLQGPLGGNVLPEVLSPLPEKSWGPSLEHPWKERCLFVAPEGPTVKDAVLLADAQNTAMEKESGREGGEDLCGTALWGSRSEPPQERSPFGEPRCSVGQNRDPPAVEPGKAGSRCKAEATSPLREEASPATPPSSLLDSCTVVEGLLFPVEYYVRTTRRMSSCQQELNLEAVIQSQLGTRRRSQRAAPKGSVASPAPPSRGLPPSPPSVGQESGHGSHDSPVGPPHRRPTQRSRRGRRKGRGRCRAPNHGPRGPLAPVGLEGNTPSEGRHSEPPEQAENRGRAGVEPAQKGVMSLQQSQPSGASLKCPEGRTCPGRTRAGAPEPPQLGRLGLPGSLQWLPSDLAPREFRLPADEFGLLQSEKVRAAAAAALKAPEVGGASGAPPGAEDADLQAAAERPVDALLSPEDQPPEPSALHTSRLLLSPANAVLEGGGPQPESQLPTPLFPLVGATPATQGFWDTPRQGPASSPPEPSAGAAGQPGCGTGEERCCPGTLCPEDGGGACREQDQAAVSPEARQALPAESGELCTASADQRDAAAGGWAEGPRGPPGDGNLQMTSKLKNSMGSSSVDVSAVWWEAADFTELCVVTAYEASVSLWRRLDSGCWETIHTWSFAEVPVFQLVPLPGAHSLVCVALGGLEIAELRLLSHSLEEARLKKSLVKAGNIKAVLGLSGQRLVSSCDGAVEVLSFPDAGGSCTRRQNLCPPEETTLAFAAVDGMAEALVGLTATNSVVVWNLGTGQLLCQMPLGYAYPAPVCHQAYSDSGLLFVVFSHPCAEEDALCGSPAFRVVAFNPKTGRSTRVMVVSLPPGLRGRYLEGDVRDTSATAVLTSGAIAVWDLLGGECTTLLPPSAEESWSLVRWSVTDKCLLAGQADGSICVYSYAARPCSATEMAEQGSWA